MKQNIQRNRVRLCKIAVEVFLLGGLLFCCLFDWNQINSYEMYNTSALSYQRGTVVEVTAEKLSTAKESEDLLLGSQTLSVRMTSGEYKGELISVQNSLVRGHSVPAEVGTKLVVCVDGTERDSLYCTVYQYDRTAGLVLVVTVFAAILLLVGRKKGAYALGGLLFSGLAILFFAVQATYHGAAPLLVSFVTLASISLFTFILICDSNRKLVVSVCATLLGIGIALVLYAIFSAALHISGYHAEEVDALVLIAQSTGLSIQHLLLIPVSITALGAVMDVTLSLASSLEELSRQNEKISRRKLIQSGMNIGKDMIGTMSNTLILAILGDNFLLALLLISYGYQTNQLLSSDVVAVQLAQSAAATIAVVISVPVTVLVYLAVAGIRQGRAAPSSNNKNRADAK